MKPSRTPVTAAPTLLALALSLAAGACRQNGQREVVQAVEDRAVEAPPPLVAEEQAEAPDEEPAEIYYDLTRYDWYRRGQPLVADGLEYRPGGRPVPGRQRAFEPAGRFQGVAYYVLEGAEPPHEVIYVPVSPGYWQPFTADVPPQPADGAPA